MSALTISNLNKQFGAVEVLKGINLDIESGEFVVLVGPSGCGKSTLLSIIAGLEKASQGEISIAGRKVDHVAAKDRDIAMVFQSYALYPTMTVRQNITFGMDCRGVPKDRQQVALADTAKLLQIDHLLDRKPAQLSGGQRQRVAMGRALVRNPTLFLFDEPLSNLDAKLRVDMRMEIKRLHSRLSTTVVYVTHDQIEAMTLASRVAVMHQGSVQQFADPDTIYDKPANLFVARFMGSPPMNTFPTRIVRTAEGCAAVVEAQAGEMIVLPTPTFQDVERYVGQEVVFGIRPECIAESTRSFGGEQNLIARVDLPVELIEPTGAETIAILRLGGRDVVARLAPDVRPRAGSLHSFALDLRKVCLFDPETEARIH